MMLFFLLVRLKYFHGERERCAVVFVVVVVVVVAAAAAGV